MVTSLLFEVNYTFKRQLRLYPWKNLYIGEATKRAKERYEVTFREGKKESYP